MWVNLVVLPHKTNQCESISFWAISCLVSQSFDTGYVSSECQVRAHILPKTFYPYCLPCTVWTSSLSFYIIFLNNHRALFKIHSLYIGNISRISNCKITKTRSTSLCHPTCSTWEIQKFSALLFAVMVNLSSTMTTYSNVIW